MLHSTAPTCGQTSTVYTVTVGGHVAADESRCPCCGQTVQNLFVNNDYGLVAYTDPTPRRYQPTAEFRWPDAPIKRPRETASQIRTRLRPYRAPVRYRSWTPRRVQRRRAKCRDPPVVRSQPLPRL